MCDVVVQAGRILEEYTVSTRGKSTAVVAYDAAPRTDGGGGAAERDYAVSDERDGFTLVKLAQRERLGVCEEGNDAPLRVTQGLAACAFRNHRASISSCGRVWVYPDCVRLVNSPPHRTCTPTGTGTGTGGGDDDADTVMAAAVKDSAMQVTVMDRVAESEMEVNAACVCGKRVMLGMKTGDVMEWSGEKWTRIEQIGSDEDADANDSVRRAERDAGGDAMGGVQMGNFGVVRSVLGLFSPVKDAAASTSASARQTDDAMMRTGEDGSVAHLQHDERRRWQDEVVALIGNGGYAEEQSLLVVMRASGKLSVWDVNGSRAGAGIALRGNATSFDVVASIRSTLVSQLSSETLTSPSSSSENAVRTAEMHAIDCALVSVQGSSVVLAVACAWCVPAANQRKFNVSTDASRWLTDDAGEALPVEARYALATVILDGRGKKAHVHSNRVRVVARPVLQPLPVDARLRVTGNGVFDDTVVIFEDGVAAVLSSNSDDALFYGAGGSLGAALDARWQPPPPMGINGASDASAVDTKGRWSLLGRALFISPHLGSESLCTTLQSQFYADAFAPFQLETDRALRHIAAEIGARVGVRGELDDAGNAVDVGPETGHRVYALLAAIGVMRIGAAQNPLLRYVLELLNSLPKAGSAVGEAQLSEKMGAYEGLRAALDAAPAPVQQQQQDGAHESTARFRRGGATSILSTSIPDVIRARFDELGERAHAAMALLRLEGEAHGQVVGIADGGAETSARQAVIDVVDHAGKAMLAQAAVHDGSSREFFFARAAACADELFKALPALVDADRRKISAGVPSPPLALARLRGFARACRSCVRVSAQTSSLSSPRATEPWLAAAHVRCALHKLLTAYISCVLSSAPEALVQEDVHACTELFDALLRAITTSRGHVSVDAELSDARALLFGFFEATTSRLALTSNGSSLATLAATEVSGVAERHRCFKPLLASLRALGRRDKIYHMMRIVGGEGGEPGFAEFVVAELLAVNRVELLELPDEFNAVVGAAIASMRADDEDAMQLRWMHEVKCNAFGDAATTLGRFAARGGERAERLWNLEKIARATAG